MLHLAALIASLGNLACIGFLPICFFKRGRLNLLWWLSALPFFGVALSLASHALSLSSDAALAPNASGVLDVLSIVLSLASTALMMAALRAHEAPLALWHQVDDAPHAIITHGVYRKIRHPLYSSYVLTLAAPCLSTAAPSIVLCFAAGLAMLTFTARREERRLLGSKLGAAYRAYMARTGRFWPAVSLRPKA